MGGCKITSFLRINNNIHFNNVSDNSEYFLKISSDFFIFAPSFNERMVGNPVRSKNTSMLGDIPSET